MALDKKISDLSAVTSFVDADLFTLVHASANYKVTWLTTKGLIHDYLATQDAAFSVAQSITATTNQLKLGTTNIVTINSIAPAASRTYSINYDIGAAANFVLAKGSTSKQMKFDVSGSTDSKTVTFVSSHTDDRTITFPDSTGTVAFSSTTGTFTSVNLTNTTNQAVLGTTNTVTLNSIAPASSRVYSMNFDIGAAANFVMAKGAVAKQMMFDISGSTDSKTATFAISHTDDRTLTFPDATGTVIVSGQSASLTNGTFTNTTNQFVLGTTNTVTINSIAPAASRVYSINYDIAAAGNFMLAKGSTSKQAYFDISGSTDSKTATFAISHTNDRTITFPDATFTVAKAATSESFTDLTATNTTNQLVLGTTNTVTVNSIAPAASRVYSINYDIAAAGNFVLAKGTTAKQMLFDVSGSTDSKTATFAISHTDDRTITFPDATGTVAVSGQSPSFASATLANTTNQLVLGTTNTVTINSIAPAASRVYSINYDIAAAANFVLAKGSTSKQFIVDASGSTDSKTMTVVSSHTDNRSLTLPNTTATLAYDVATTDTNTLTGIWAAAQAITIGIAGTAELTVLTFPAVTSTANTAATITLGTALPAAYRPSNDLDIPIWVVDAGSTVAGNCVITTAGAVTIGVGHGGNFTGSGSSGTVGFTVALS